MDWAEDGSEDLLAHAREDKAQVRTLYADLKKRGEKAQMMAAHSSPRTTKLYDRTNDQVSLDEVEMVVF